MNMEDVIEKVVQCQRTFVDENMILDYETDFIDSVVTDSNFIQEPCMMPVLVKICEAVASGKEDRLKPTLRSAMKMLLTPQKADLLDHVLGL